MPFASVDAAPTAMPTAAPSSALTAMPTTTTAPAAAPTAAPTAALLAAPARTPTAASAAAPTAVPTTAPTAAPAAAPTATPTPHRAHGWRGNGARGHDADSADTGTRWLRDRERYMVTGWGSFGAGSEQHCSNGPAPAPTRTVGRGLLSLFPPPHFRLISPTHQHWGPGARLKALGQSALRYMMGARRS